MTTASVQDSAMHLDPNALRQQFPILEQRVNGHPLVYLDNAATTQKPKCVLDTIQHYYGHDNANVHRGVHELSVRATAAYEQARRMAQAFLGASRAEEIVFTRSVTEAVNLVAQTLAIEQLQAGDELIISGMEHHSNIVPWQLLRDRMGVVLKVIPIDDHGELCLDSYRALFSAKTKLVAVTHVSNTLGTVNPIREMCEIAHQHDAQVLVDGAQAVQHLAVDVKALGADYYVFTGHKIYGPTGIGVLFGRYELLDALPPFQGGGEMIKSVTFDHTEYNDIPFRSEAGTPNIAGAIGLSRALEFVRDLGIERIAAHEKQLMDHAMQALSTVDGLTVLGTPAERAGVFSFTLKGIHPHDIGTILDQMGVAIRTGHHCAQPVMDHFGVPATARVSLAAFNTPGDIAALVDGIKKVCEVFGG